MIREARHALSAAVLVAAAWGTARGRDATTAPVLPSAVQTLRASLAPYASLTLARDAGYDVALTDCMSNGDVDAMGIHFGDPALIDATVDAEHPEVLIYEPGPSGAMSLVGVEFVVPFAIVPTSAPRRSASGNG